MCTPRYTTRPMWTDGQGSNLYLSLSTPNGIRTRAPAVKVRDPRPLDDGSLGVTPRSSVIPRLGGLHGFDPRMGGGPDVPNVRVTGEPTGADNGVRTRGLDLGKVALCLLSYIRITRSVLSVSPHADWLAHTSGIEPDPLLSGEWWGSNPPPPGPQPGALPTELHPP